MQNMILTPHFTLREFTESATARKYGIDNSAPAEVVKNLRRLCENTLEPLREVLDMPVIITSGYRCKALNLRISCSSRKSQHMSGQAADFYIAQRADQSLKCKVYSVKEGAPGVKEDTPSLECNVYSVKEGNPSVKEDVPSLKCNAQGHRELLVKAFRMMLISDRIDFDQLILYPTFIHVSYVSPTANRHRILVGKGGGLYGSVTRERALTLV